MNFEVSSGNVALIIAILGGFAQFIRLEVTSGNQEKRIAALEAKQEADLLQVKNSHSDNNKVIWDKIETIHSSLLTIVQTLGRLEGKIDKDK